jgi:acetoin utilization deacetylase AcuC-like enzyme
MTSGTVRPWAAASSAFVGRRGRLESEGFDGEFMRRWRWQMASFRIAHGRAEHTPWGAEAMSVLLFTDDLYLEHETGEHPERPDRLRAIHRRLGKDGLIERCNRGPVRAATPAELERIHPRRHIERVAEVAAAGGGRLDPDTVLSGRSYEVARHAAGAAVEAVDHVLSGHDSKALCLVRPPGHHALPSRAMGFCLFNNVALAAAHARAAHDVERVLIVDWDVHHGNGTQDIFYDDGQVGFFSAHRSPFYPGTGAADETGSGAGLGTTFNLPLRFGISRHDYRAAFTNVLEDALARCRPELILVSAGFDAHRADPIGSLGLETEDFAALTKLIVEAAEQSCGGRLVSLLEGGYDLAALSESVAVHLQTLLDAGGD